MNVKIIKTKEEYENALVELEPLMDAEPGSKAEETLELLSLLIEKYENEHYPITLPDPIEAIKFRMEQQGLTQKDLIPYIGPQGRVSEVLNGKRPLTLTMIRNLNAALEIPAEVLIRKPGGTIPDKQFDLEDYPFNEMFNHGYFSFFDGTLAQAKQQFEECLESFFSVFQGKTPEPVHCRSSEGKIDEKALVAWQARVLSLSMELKLPEFDAASFNKETIREISRLSAYTTGPLKAQEYLHKMGIPLIIQEHLPHTYLDGGCFNSPDHRPIIGMTLRYDRQDNFWFTLIHELSHVFLHLLKGEDTAFFDDTEHINIEDCNPQELEANQLGSDLLIPPDIWNKEKGVLLDAQDTYQISKLAEGLEICPAIIAGRIRHEKNDFSILSNLIGSGTIRSLFAEG